MYLSISLSISLADSSSNFGGVLQRQCTTLYLVYAIVMLFRSFIHSFIRLLPTSSDKVFLMQQTLQHSLNSAATVSGGAINKTHTTVAYLDRKSVV